MKSASERAKPSNERAIKILVNAHRESVGVGDEVFDRSEFLPAIF
jgi:hypothetical protein